jgi:hypothetical protein
VKHTKRNKTSPDRDQDAYERAIAWMRRHSSARAAQIETKLRCEGFEAAGEFASYAAQCETLRLKPWQAPPARCRATDPDPNVYGCRPAEIALRNRLSAAGLSVHEPDPLSALARRGLSPSARAARGLEPAGLDKPASQTPLGGLCKAAAAR